MKEKQEKWLKKKANFIKKTFEDAISSCKWLEDGDKFLLKEFIKCLEEDISKTYSNELEMDKQYLKEFYLMRYYKCTHSITYRYSKTGYIEKIIRKLENRISSLKSNYQSSKVADLQEDLSYDSFGRDKGYYEIADSLFNYFKRGNKSLSVEKFRNITEDILDKWKNM